MTLISRLRRLVLYHVTILESCLCIHASKPTHVNKALHAALVDLFLDYRRNIETKFVPAPSLLNPSNSIHLPASGSSVAAAATSSQASTSLSPADSTNDKQSSVFLRAIPQSAVTLFRSTMSRTKLGSPHNKTGSSLLISEFDQHAAEEAQLKQYAEMLQALRELYNKVNEEENNIENEKMPKA